MREMVQDGLPAYFAYIAGVLEMGGGALLLAGFNTRLIGLLLAGEMAVAMWKGEHFFAHPLAVGQYELALALGAGAFALATFGGGSTALDTLFGKGRSARMPKSRD
jgi:putative oxidoreductase